MIKLSECIDIFDKKRIPLSSQERLSREKIYPYYGATEIMDYVDDYLFDGSYLLVAEDGTVTDENYHPVVQRAEGKFWVNNHAHIIRAKSNIDQDYLYYALKSTNIKKFISGSIQLKLNQENLLKIEIPYIEKNEQIKVVRILKLLDEKINLNYKLLDTLNSSLKAVYQQMFKQYVVDGEDTSSRIYCSELNKEIPENWECTKLEKLIKHVTTGLNPRKNFVLNDGDINYVTVKNLTSYGVLDLSKCDKICLNSKILINKRSMITSGDILFASIAPLGRCHLIIDNPVSLEINESVFSIRPSEHITSEFLYMLLTDETFVKIAEHCSTGSVFSGIRISTLLNMNVLLPSKNSITAFTKATKSIFIKKNEIEKEIAYLKKERDFLLPQIIKVVK